MNSIVIKIELLQLCGTFFVSVLELFIVSEVLGLSEVYASLEGLPTKHACWHYWHVLLAGYKYLIWVHDNTLELCKSEDTCFLSFLLRIREYILYTRGRVIIQKYNWTLQPSFFKRSHCPLLSMFPAEVKPALKVSFHSNCFNKWHLSTGFRK